MRSDSLPLHLHLGGTRTVNRELEDKPETWQGSRDTATNLRASDQTVGAEPDRVTTGRATAPAFLASQRL
jgi:hypothetical protein